MDGYVGAETGPVAAVAIELNAVAVEDWWSVGPGMGPRVQH